MYYRTKTYIAGDWTGDKDAIDQIYKWNRSNYWKLDFVDAHSLTQCRDTSLFCTIKGSLRERMNASKKFILVVGKQTVSITKGGCQMCGSYNSHSLCCAREHNVDYRSYVKFECDLAIDAYDEDKIDIVVLYNSTEINKALCPKVVRDIGIHIPMRKKSWSPYGYYTTWDYQAVQKAIMANQRRL